MKIVIAVQENLLIRELMRLLRAHLEPEDILVAEDTPQLLSAILREGAEVVVLDVIFQSGEGLRQLLRLRELPLRRQPEFIFLSAIVTTHFLEYVAVLYYPTYLVNFPFAMRNLAGMVRCCLNAQQTLRYRQSEQDSRELEVCMRALALSPKCRGWHCIRACILRLLEEPELIYGLTKRLYPEVGRQLGLTGGGVERAIRRAIGNAWLHEGVPLQETLFWQKPTNRMFLLALTRHLQQKRQNAEKPREP